MRPENVNFGEYLASRIQTFRESDVHPHVPAERADLFHAIDPGSAEIESLNLLNALAFSYKPVAVLETGTGRGFTTIALASALRANGLGHATTDELDPSVVDTARRNMEAFDPGLHAWASFHTGDSRTFIREWQGPRFDFVLFDSLIQFRHLELEDLMERDLLEPGCLCAFHDTSRRRGESQPDFCPEMIEALDRHSAGKEWLEVPFGRGLRVLRWPSATSPLA